MQAVVLIVMLAALSGCVDGRLVLKGHDSELAHKCRIDPYKPDCLDPPPLFKSS